MFLCYLLMVDLFLRAYTIFKWLWACVAQTFDRYTAPTIQVPLPEVNFTTAPAAEPLHPRSAGEGQIQCYDKGTNAPIGTVKAFTPAEVREVVVKARKAQQVWALTPFSTRRKLLFALMDYILAHQEFICQTACVECGKTMMDGTLGEMLTTFEKLRWTAAHGEEVLQEEVRDVGLMTIHKRASVRYVPFGVIGAIVSWNYPFHNIYGPMISALFAGNAFVGKVSEYSSYYASYYESIVKDGLRQLGYSPDLVSFLTGFAETGEAVVSSVDKLTFIGSPSVGKIIMRNAAATLTPVVLELGGKDPAIICEDADLEQVIPVVMRGNFQNCGQNCVGLERILVQAKIHDQLVLELTRLTRALTQGPASQGQYDLGAMTMGKAAIPKIQQLVDDTVKAGATLICGGKTTSDQFYPATILTGVTPDMPIAQEEVFGPVMVIMKFKTDQDAVKMVNACAYGLGSSVFSADIPRAQAIADRIRTGMVNINDFGINYLCQSLPFGGVKISGFDRFAGREGLRGNCIVRASTTDRIPGVKTTIPSILQYPISPVAFTFMENLAQVIYGRLPRMITSVSKLLVIKPGNSTDKKKA
ncbi:aldehyde dehydrogenase [Leishmania donovani]|uniref:Aldehyde_dehydrogenase_-_putative n=3 Tax=Leishmania donovani species complex TaxID=38574 RepID=A0A6L0XMA3_LEIIN|nr:putative aldehyde dehydrogenase [Leishmania infantum JPCM5]XP_003863003.1 aldehyde dehydrogenase, putative [Leishmania donovani]CAC9515320.1 aldehyde_dehydrogenase_-_putative [Leishmania infantum]AYU81092.1 aldehyde dehydrogenase, putative [Leishmania donovani]TPP43244.1 Aldehyde dehydrogenase family protein [Leishmania donovani]TPP45842.1 Aldehyde dehydrogenase family protein [Leishmania donovani]CAJ1991084.1 aldehyde dehydrogenase [Leishmania donovani]|eukprot:XP_001467138.1 putative aldehyde dehydrogenase [Leishmania infantum JPCM5]